MSIGGQTFETPEEREIRVRRNTAKRVRFIVAILGVSIVARIFVKNPPPPQAVQYSASEVRFVPGMLDAIPASERNKMDPRMLARMQQLDDEARRGAKPSPPASAVAETPYKASETPLASEAEAEKTRQFAYSYAKKRQEVLMAMEEIQVRNTSKTTLVQFTRGGYLHVEQAIKTPRNCEIRFDRTLVANLPSKMVQDVTADAAAWTPPLSSREVELKPARGITIILERQLARHVTVARFPMQ
jgi:hypothetical protein